jgi:hypothetical protein
VEAEGAVRVHTLTGHDALPGAVAALKSFCLAAEARFPLVVHDDGTLTRADGRLVAAHLPGARLVPRAEADARVIPALRRAGFTRCARYRAAQVLALKYFDVQMDAAEGTVVYIDSDVLFFRRPDALLDALAVPDEGWRYRYNADVATGGAYDWYAWDPRLLRAATGTAIAPRANTGVVCLRRPAPDWSLAERCLALPRAHGLHYAEQGLYALEFARGGAEPLPPDYDVAFRHARRGAGAEWLREAEGGHLGVSQHYCGGALQKTHFFRDFSRHVAPALRAAGA